MVRTKFARVVSAVAALELVLVGKRDGVDQEIERAPLLAQCVANTASTDAISSTSQGSTSEAPTDWASGLTRRPSASP